MVEDWRAALALQEHLKTGHRLSPVPGLASGRGELSYYEVPDAYLEVMRGVRLAFADSRPGSHADARQWRAVGQGALSVQGSRLHLSTPQPGVSLGWVGLSRVHTDNVGLILDYGADQFRLRLHCPNYLMVLVMHVGFGVTTELEPPYWLR